LSEYAAICEAPSAEVDQEAAADELEGAVDVAKLVSNMKMSELREGLIKRDLSTDGKRSDWGDRLIKAMSKDQDSTRANSQSAESDDKLEAEQPQDEEEGDSGDEENDESSEEESSDEQETDESETADSDDEDAAARAARQEALKIALAARRAAQKPNKRAERSAAVAAKVKDVKEVAKAEAKIKKMGFQHQEGEELKSSRMQSNFGLTKFIKP